jgi:ectoine hydroxylase-related dioxygenase (phytanoyl-CoA dioxygenase family)
MIKNFYDSRDISTLEKEILEKIRIRKNDIGIKEVLSEMQEFDSYKRVVNSLELKEFIETVFNCKCNLYTRKVLRYKSPVSPFSTGVHYDFVYLRRGSGEVFNVWIPIGDIKLDQGGISYLENSKPISKELELNYIKDSTKLSPDLRTSAYNKLSKRNAWITLNMLKYSKEKNKKWLVSNFKAGDIVIHSPYIIHATFANANSKNEVKISTDIRFDYSKDEADVRWDRKWNPFDGL